ncbi:hypothetical protein, variant [Capsaspora owczarzaki ATCC 30864]|nr:hypothetical protein, variant [Capsaspora owczarzaki ATCC 30864]
MLSFNKDGGGAAIAGGNDQPSTLPPRSLSSASEHQVLSTAVVRGDSITSLSGAPPSPVTSHQSVDIPPPSPGWGSATVSAGSAAQFQQGSRQPRPGIIAKSTSEHWERVAACMKQLFQRASVPDSIEFRNDLVRLTAKAENEIFVLLKFKEIMTKGMIILREQFKDVAESRLFVERMGHIWTVFYTQILPELMATFQPVAHDTSSDLGIRRVALSSWRDHILLNSVIRQKVEDAIAARVVFSPTFLQMLLVLQSIQENNSNEQAVYAVLSGLGVPYLHVDDPTASRMYTRSISESSLKTMVAPDAETPPPNEAASHFARHTMGRTSRKSYASDRDLVS